MKGVQGAPPQLRDLQGLSPLLAVPSHGSSLQPPPPHSPPWESPECPRAGTVLWSLLLPALPAPGLGLPTMLSSYRLVLKHLSQVFDSHNRYGFTEEKTQRDEAT